MATREQRRKEKHNRKRQEKKDQLRKRQEALRRTLNISMPDIPSGSRARHHERLLAQVPQAWPGETPEDVAVFDDSLLKTLSPEMADQAKAIRDALKLACESRGEEALKCTASIPRSSPYSQWRLFVRGLVSWLDNDAPAASEAWERLDLERRAGRIATAMMNSLSPHLEQVKIGQSSSPTGDASSTNWSDRLDGALLYHAKLLRRVRFDRPAIRLAEAGLKVPEEAKELLIGPRKMEWLQRFVSEYRDAEPELVAALQQVALRRAFAQDFVNLFEDATRAFEGPPHDRRNLLLSYFFYLQFDDESSEEKGERCLERYLKDDLPKNQALSAPLRAALLSQVHLAEASSLILPKVSGMFKWMFEESEDAKGIRQHLKASIKACPANRLAHKTYAEWIESKLGDERLTQNERKPLVNELARVMESWSRGLPEDVEPRLWLVDHLLENEQLEEAKPHVDWLAAARQDDPRVRATPWKWQLLDAMRLCRRKAWLPQVAGRLDEAERLWPAWLTPRWLPYLRAAVALRQGKQDELEAERERIWRESDGTRGSLTDACMMLGAAQHMRVPAPDLKSLRAPVDQALKNLRSISDEDLLRLSGFFWDLHRAQLLYPAYRMHGKKITDAILARLRANPSIVLDHLNDADVHCAVLLCSEHRCFQLNYQLKFPPWFSNNGVPAHTLFAAAQLNAFLKTRHHWDATDYKHLGPILREAAKSERDVYYRYWFVALADELDEMLARRSTSRFGFDFNPFSAAFGESAEDEEDEDEDEHSFDPDCDCQDCQAARRAYEASR